MIHLAADFLDGWSQKLAIWLGKKRLDRMYAKLSALEVPRRLKVDKEKEALLGKKWDVTEPDEKVWVFAIKRCVEICDHFDIPLENSKVLRALAEIHHGCGSIKDLDFFRDRLIGCFSPTFALFQAMVYKGDVNVHEARLTLKVKPLQDALDVLRVQSTARLYQLLNVKE